MKYICSRSFTTSAPNKYFITFNENSYNIHDHNLKIMHKQLFLIYKKEIIMIISATLYDLYFNQMRTRAVE